MERVAGPKKITILGQGDSEAIRVMRREEKGDGLMVGLRRQILMDKNRKESGKRCVVGMLVVEVNGRGSKVWTLSLNLESLRWRIRILHHSSLPIFLIGFEHETCMMCSLLMGRW